MAAGQELLARLTAVRQANAGIGALDDHLDQLFGLVHLERGDSTSAASLLRAAAQHPPAVLGFDVASRIAEQARVEPAPPMHQSDWILGLAISPDGRYAVSAGDADGVLHYWDLRTGECVCKLSGHTKPGRVVTITVDGRVGVVRR